MFCPNCGNPNPKGTKFCEKCGTEIPVSKHNFWKTTKQGIYKIRIPLIVSFIVLIIVIGGVLLFNRFYDDTKLNWNDAYQDNAVEYTNPTTLELGVEAKTKKGTPKITFHASSGKIKSDNYKVTWELPKKEGTYTLTAKTAKGKTIKKTISVITYDQNKAYYGVIESSKQKNADSDQDGLTDEDEQKYKTDPYLKDSDQDGLSDDYEIHVSKTDPLKKDSDEDGLHDGDELDLGLDPLKKDSKNDGTIDGKRNLSYTLSEKQVTIEITGQGNIASTTVDVSSNPNFEQLEGVINSIYHFKTDGKLEKAIVTIPYNTDQIQQKGLQENQLSLYYFDQQKKEFEKIDSTIDQNSHTIKATLNHFSDYVIADASKIVARPKTDIMFVIDNSISMYTEDQVKTYGFTSCTGCDGNDTTFKRISLSNKLMDMFTGNYRFGVGEFSGKYTHLLDITDQKEKAKEKITSIKSSLSKTYKAGTNIIDALKSSIKTFDDNAHSHYLILLTDGENTSGNLSSEKNSIIEEAKKKKIKICTIGLGEVDTNDLNQISTETGCAYYPASNDNVLDEIYSKVGADINYQYVDTDQDGKVDGVIEEDSGFITSRDGFSFANFNSNLSDGGHCYGMATFASLYYQNKLPETLPDIDKWGIFFSGVDHFHMKAKGYNLKDTSLLINNQKGMNLHDYSFQNKAIQFYFGKEIPNDYRDRVVNEVLYIKKEYADLLNSVGMTFSFPKIKNQKNYKKYERALLNLSNDTFLTKVEAHDRELLLAIYRLFILQMNDSRISFSSDSDKAYESLLKELSNKNPVVLTINGNHAINATRIIRDLNDPNQFKIEVYDNNFPNEIRYISAKRHKYNKVQLDFSAWKNTYEYQFSYDGNDKTTVSLNFAKVE